MATAAQIAANRENAQHSPGPTSEAGKKASSLNNLRHGLAGQRFFFLEWEKAESFDTLQAALEEEHKPQTPTEQILVEKMVQHYWLSGRARTLQTIEMKDNPFDDQVQRRVAMFLRYEAQQERLFHRALHDLLKLRSEGRKQEIGFESQKRAQAQEVRVAEKHKLTIATLETRLEHKKQFAPTTPAVTRPTNADPEPPRSEKIAA